jgi:hypothetical protein
MANEESTKTNAERANEASGDQSSAKERFEIPECCRQMMAQLMGHGNDPPGIFGRLMTRMMKACCGNSTEEHSRSAQV